MQPILIAILIVCERILPFRSRELKFFSPASERLAGVGFYVFTQLTIRILAAGPLLAAVSFMKTRGFEQRVGVPVFAFQFVVTFVLCELMVYVDHYLKHEIPVLWRMHAMHHAPKELDGLVAYRRHPIELFLSIAETWLLIFSLVYFLGFSPYAVVAAISIGSFYNVVVHSNINFEKILGRRWNGYYERALFTPQSHSVHHVGPYFKKNYGRSLVIFDKLFGTFSDYRVTNDEFGFLTPEGFPRKISAQLIYFVAAPLRARRTGPTAD